jgi:hypothetical protein
MKVLESQPILAKLALRRLDKELTASGLYHIRCSEHADAKIMLAIRLALIAMLYPAFVLLIFCLSFLFPEASAVAFFMQCWSIATSSATFWITILVFMVYLIRVKDEKALHESYTERYDKLRTILVGYQLESDFTDCGEFVRFIKDWQDTIRNSEPKRNPVIERSIKTKG